MDVDINTWSLRVILNILAVIFFSYLTVVNVYDLVSLKTNGIKEDGVVVGAVDFRKISYSDVKVDSERTIRIASSLPSGSVVKIIYLEDSPGVNFAYYSHIPISGLFINKTPKLILLFLFFTLVLSWALRINIQDYSKVNA